jgi:ankyrin repeat protein
LFDFENFLKPVEILSDIKELHDACSKDDLEKVKMILLENPSLLNEGLDDNGKTALSTASSFIASSSVVSFLLEQENVDVNKADEVVVMMFDLF